MGAPRSDAFGMVGHRLVGKYDVVEAIAETTFSVIYRAEHRVWKRPVAIKAFKARMFGDRARGELLDSFVREGALLLDLSERCAAICQARDIGSTVTAQGEWVPFMVLEWLEGESLETMLQRERADAKPPRTMVEALDLLEPIAHALSLAHERGIAHLDVKPGNVLVLADAARDFGRCKLLDFGISKVVGDARVDDEGFVARAFTPEYGAPEQFVRALGGTGPRTDVFALALILVEVLAGREALHGHGVADLRDRACDPIERPTPRTLGVPVTAEVDGVFARALAVCPQDRFTDVSAFWSALKRADEVRAPDPRDQSNVPIALLRKRGPARRRWLVPAVAAVSAAVAVVALQKRGVSPAAWAQRWSFGSVSAIVAPGQSVAPHPP